MAQSTALQRLLAPLRERYYRRRTHLNFRRYEEVETLIEWLDAQGGERILDIGCNDGFYDHRIATDTGAHVVGIDISENGIETARTRNQLEGTEYHFMNAEEITFEDESFDRVLSCCVIEHFQNDDQVLEHVHRVLKPSGSFIFSADSLSNPEVTDKEREEHRVRYAVNTFYTPEIIKEKLDRVGFEILETQYILTTPLSLALARLSWWVDDLPAFPREILYSLLNPINQCVSDLSEKRSRRKDSGLTLLIRARKP
jgi:ubiquinone/menaquinone biosynthesis C-methylase UbiE